MAVNTIIIQIDIQFKTRIFYSYQIMKNNIIKVSSFLYNQF